MVQRRSCLATTPAMPVPWKPPGAFHQNIPCPGPCSQQNGPQPHDLRSSDGLMRCRPGRRMPNQPTDRAGAQGVGLRAAAPHAIPVDGTAHPYESPPPPPAPLHVTPLVHPPPPPGGGTVTWPMNNKKSLGNHGRRRKFSVGYTRIQVTVVWCPSPPGVGGNRRPLGGGWTFWGGVQRAAHICSAGTLERFPPPSLVHAPRFASQRHTRMVPLHWC